eukprot:m.110681 g.110681  ORF g.110681 m.110681 type:complete len:121 (+) comp51813_c0_seq11:368-730(+)
MIFCFSHCCLAVTLALVFDSSTSYAEAGLLAVVLSMALLNRGEISQDQLWIVLNRLGCEQKVEHPTFGDISQLLDTTLTKQKYLVRTTRVESEVQKVFYQWGPRARFSLPCFGDFLCPWS